MGMSVQSGASQVKVLLVDGEPANRLALRGVLEGLDRTLVGAQSGQSDLRSSATSTGAGVKA
jgi:CheY-like chemotaxis protein